MVARSASSSLRLHCVGAFLLRWLIAPPPLPDESPDVAAEGGGGDRRRSGAALIAR